MGIREGEETARNVDPAMGFESNLARTSAPFLLWLLLI